MDPNHYFYGWMIYLASAFGCFLVWVRMTRSLSRFFKGLLRGFVAVALFTPWYVDKNQDYLAPAGLVTLYDALTKGAEAAYRAGHVVAVAEILMFVLLLGLFIVLPSPKSKKKHAKPTTEGEENQPSAKRTRRSSQQKKPRNTQRSAKSQGSKERITPTI